MSSHDNLSNPEIAQEASKEELTKRLEALKNAQRAIENLQAMSHGGFTNYDNNSHDNTLAEITKEITSIETQLNNIQ